MNENSASAAINVAGYNSYRREKGVARKSPISLIKKKKGEGNSK